MSNFDRMEKSFLAVALVQNMHNGRTRWLLNQSSGESKRELNFIVGERLEQESFRESVTREVAWQLGLDRNRDFIVSNMAQLSVEFVEIDSEAGQERHIALAFYSVHVGKRNILDAIDEVPSTTWVSAAKICAGVTSEGKPIQSDVVEWINKYEVVRPWQV